MMNLINNFSLGLMIISLGVAVLHPAIKLPCWFDLLIWAVIIGAVALLINNTYSPNIEAEILFRFAGSILVTGAVIHKYRRSVRK